MFLLKQVTQTYREAFPEVSLISSESSLHVVRLAISMAVTQKLWQNTSYLQRGGMNSFCLVITILAQQMIICGPKLGERRRLSPPPSYASGNQCQIRLLGP